MPGAAQWLFALVRPVPLPTDTPGAAQRLLALWPVWLPLAVGALAIYWLLPRPRAYPALWGALAGLAALVLGGVFLVRAAGLTPETVLFYAFAGHSVAFGGLLVTQRNPARAALSFAVVVLSTCGLFLLLAAPFLMAATIIIYAGAIVVTFLFVLMLAQQQGLSDADARSREPLLATLTGFVLLGALLYVLTRVNEETVAAERQLGQIAASLDEISTDEALAEVRALRKQEPPEAEQERRAREEKLTKYDQPFVEARKLFVARGWRDLAQAATVLEGDWAQMGDRPADQYRKAIDAAGALVKQGAARNQLSIRHTPQSEGRLPPALSSLSGTPPTTAPENFRTSAETGLPELPADNPAFLGRSLFTDFLLPVELGGTLLLVATVGAIAIAQRRFPAGRSAEGLARAGGLPPHAGPSTGPAGSPGSN